MRTRRRFVDSPGFYDTISFNELSPQLASTLVEPFLRGTEPIRTDHAGVGLGLAIVKSTTQAHDGTLTVAPGPRGDSASRCSYPPRHHPQADDSRS
jgi:K+-sensing histidine kinase KdpD